MKITRNIGMLLLGIWLILTGLLPLAGINIEGIGLILNLLAIAAGFFILTQR